MPSYYAVKNCSALILLYFLYNHTISMVIDTAWTAANRKNRLRSHTKAWDLFLYMKSGNMLKCFPNIVNAPVIDILLPGAITSSIVLSWASMLILNLVRRLKTIEIPYLRNAVQDESMLLLDSWITFAWRIYASFSISTFNRFLSSLRKKSLKFTSFSDLKIELNCEYFSVRNFE